MHTIRGTYNFIKAVPITKMLLKTAKTWDVCSAGFLAIKVTPVLPDKILSK